MEPAVAQGGTPDGWHGNHARGIGAPARVASRLLRFSRSATFGNVVIVLFFVAQALDGALTYIGLRTFGPSIEGNPLLAWLMAAFGETPALAAAKVTAVGLGMVLHLASGHRAVALLTALYFSAAVVPWMLLLVVAGHLL